MSDAQSGEELCPACLAFPGEHDRRIIVGFTDGRTVQTWHKDGCPFADRPPPADDGSTA